MHVYVCMYEYVCMYVYIYIHIYISGHKHIHIHAYIRMSANGQHKSALARILKNDAIISNVYMHIYDVYVCIYICMYGYICICRT